MGLPIWLMAAQTAMQAVGAHQEAKAQERAYKAQAQAAEQNAAIQAKKAEQVAEGYAQKQRQLTDRMKLVRGQALAASGATGGTGAGSIADILNASQEEYEKDSMNLLSAQRNDTWSSYVNQVNYLNQQNAALAAAKNAKAEGRAKVFSTILGGAASIYGASGGSDSPTANTDYNLSEWYNNGGGYLSSIKLGSAKKGDWTNFGANALRY
jgi:hypothetical protein